ncbi:MAG: hypothetical protein BroJett040_11480 [Oligoflexia bacterium]|nr:MAG: hypothetical protein BroJett040_11480 [Oligoflexia bacterium]
MKKNILFLFSILALTTIYTLPAQTKSPSYLSAKRELHEHYTTHAFRAGLSGKKINSQRGTGLKPTLTTPYEVKKPLAELNRSLVPLWLGSPESLQKTFEQMRDTRVLTQDPTFPRRPTWLYPDDGCFARAAVLSVEAIALEVNRPGKIFVFGDLVINTPNSPDGIASWWYHVVVGYRLGNEIFIFDPSIEARFPVTIEKWIELMGGEKSQASIAICDSGAFSPESACYGGTEMSIEDIFHVQNRYLEPEWSRLEEMNRDPIKELGDSPPWLIQPTQEIILTQEKK